MRLPHLMKSLTFNLSVPLVLALFIGVAFLSFPIAPLSAQSSFLPYPSFKKTTPPTSRAINPLPSSSALIKDLDALAQQTDPQKALQIEKNVITHWSTPSKGASIVLTDRANAALQQHRQPEIALELMSQVVDYQPQWVQGRYLRGLMLLFIDDDERAMADFMQVLALEPRHFLALSHVASLFEKRKNFIQAYQVLEKIKRIHPQMSGLDQHLIELKKRIDGQRI